MLNRPAPICRQNIICANGFARAGRALASSDRSATRQSKSTITIGMRGQIELAIFLVCSRIADGNAYATFQTGFNADPLLAPVFRSTVRVSPS